MLIKSHKPAKNLKKTAENHPGIKIFNILFVNSINFSTFIKVNKC